MDYWTVVSVALCLCGVLSFVSLVVSPAVNFDAGNGLLEWRTAPRTAGETRNRFARLGARPSGLGRTLWAFLFGGVDSTAVVGMMSRELTAPVRTFSIGFDEADFDELQYARRADRQFGTDHHDEIVRADAIAVPALVRHFGEPFGDSSAIPTYLVSQLAHRHVPMVLTGDGGDEAFMGYRRYFSWQR